MAQGPRVPPFGAWGSGENAPNYTTHFNSAREKHKVAGQMINPNDPQQNPHMFPNTIGTKVEPEPIKKGVRGHMRRGSKDETTGGKSRHQSRTKSTNRDDETIKQRTWCWKQREGSKGVEMPEEGAAVPPFGKWDVENPESEDFTGKFKRVQQYRHHGPEKSPGKLGTPTSSFTTQGNQNTDDSAKTCCFPWCRK